MAVRRREKRGAFVNSSNAQLYVNSLNKLLLIAFLRPLHKGFGHIPIANIVDLDCRERFYLCVFCKSATWVVQCLGLMLVHPVPEVIQYSQSRVNALYTWKI